MIYTAILVYWNCANKQKRNKANKITITNNDRL